jgi:hypothetical protein
MSYEEEDTCTPYEEEDTFTPSLVPSHPAPASPCVSFLALLPPIPAQLLPSALSLHSLFRSPIITLTPPSSFQVTLFRTAH